MGIDQLGINPWQGFRYHDLAALQQESSPYPPLGVALGQLCGLSPGEMHKGALMIIFEISNMFIT